MAELKPTPFHKGMIRLNNAEGGYKFVPEGEELEHPGWTQECPKRFWIQRETPEGVETSQVLAETVDLYLKNGWSFGRPCTMSQEARKQLSQRMVGQRGNPHTPESKEALRKANLGRKMSEEDKRKMREKALLRRGSKYIHNRDSGEVKRVPEGELQDWFDRGWSLGKGYISHFSEESRIRQSQRASEREGSVYVFNTKTLERRRVKGETLDQLISEGWVLGRFSAGYEPPSPKPKLFLLYRLEGMNREWMKEYVSFVQKVHSEDLQRGEDHHILPRSLFPEYTNLDLHPWNRSRMVLSDHLWAHYLLFKAYRCSETWFSLSFMMREEARTDLSEEVIDRIIQSRCLALSEGFVPVSKETRLRLSRAALGKKQTQETILKRVHSRAESEKQKPRKVVIKKGRDTRSFNTPEAQEKRRQTMMARYNTTGGMIGKKHSEDTCLRISKSLTGKVHETSTRNKMSETHRAKMLEKLSAEDHRVLLEVWNTSKWLPRGKQVTLLYIISNGMKIIREGRCEQVSEKQWRSARTFLAQHSLVA